MLGTPVWCTYLKGLNSGVAAMNTMTHKGSLYALVRGYSRKECACGAPEQAAGAAGKAVEAWPRSDVSAPHAWRPDCPHELPPNNDPYRIRVPDIAVPPLPPSNAKWTGALWTNNPADHRGYSAQQGWQQPPQQEEALQEETAEEPGIFAKIKGFFERLGQKQSKKEGEGDAMITGNLEQLCLCRVPSYFL